MAVATAALLMVPLAGCRPSAGGSAPAGASLVVDKRDPRCRDKPSSATGPYCSISAAAARAGAGQVVLVRPGTYREKVEVAGNGTEDEPIVISAVMPGTVTVAGGDNGFRLESKSHLVVQGFRITDTRSHGIVVIASDHVTLAGNVVTGAGTKRPADTVHGIAVSSSTSITIVGNEIDGANNDGVQLDSTTTGSTVERNLLRHNGRGTRPAGPGIDVRGDRNRILDNRSNDNEDSGIQFHTGATDNTAAGNVTVGNGDHGIDVVDSPRQRIVNNTVVGNATSGINLEGASDHAVISGNVSVDNAVHESTIIGNIRVTSPSVAGTTADHDLVFGGPELFVWGSRGLSTIAAVAADTGQEASGVEADPALDEATQRPSRTSPAVDAADRELAPPLDGAGRPRAGAPDIGALEATGTAPPSLVLVVGVGSRPQVVWTESPDADAGYEVVVGDDRPRRVSAGRRTLRLSRPLGGDRVGVRARGTTGLSETRFSSTTA